MHWAYYLLIWRWEIITHSVAFPVKLFPISVFILNDFQQAVSEFLHVFAIVYGLVV